jgi:DNA modification methylase
VEVRKYPVIIGDENTDTARKAVALYLEKYPDSKQVWFGANYYSDMLEPSPCWVVWNKETTGNFADCELAWTNVNKAARLFTHRWNGLLRDSEREKRWHPTQKPAALAKWIYENFTDDGATIFDPFAGAGWSILGAQQSGRKARAIEMSHEYIAVVLERMSIAFPDLPIEHIG